MFASLTMPANAIRHSSVVAKIDNCDGSLYALPALTSIALKVAADRSSPKLDFLNSLEIASVRTPNEASETSFTSSQVLSGHDFRTWLASRMMPTTYQSPRAVAVNIIPKWAIGPTVFEVQLFHGDHTRRLRTEIFYSPFSKASIAGVSVLERQLSDGLLLDIYLLDHIDCFDRSRIKATLESKQSSSMFRDLRGILKIPEFRVQALEMLGMRNMGGKSRTSTAQSAVPVSLIMQFTLPTDSEQPDPALRDGIPLKGRLPNTYIFNKPFGYLIRSRDHGVLVSGSVL